VKCVVFVLLLSLTALAQSSPNAAPSAHPPNHKPPANRAAVAPDEGTLNGNTYTSDYFGFSYTYPEDAEFNENFMEEHQDAERRAFVLFAVQRPDAQPGYLDMLVIMADRNASPAVTTAAEYLRRSASTHFERQGFEVLRPAYAVTIAGRPFVRADYHKTDVYQTVLATLWRGYAIVFNVAGPTSDSVDKLVATLNSLRFTPSKTAAPAQGTTKRSTAPDPAKP
jgi:hypothetical protein